MFAGVKILYKEKKSSGSLPVANVFFILVEKRALLKIVQLGESLLFQFQITRMTCENKCIHVQSTILILISPFLSL